MNLKASLPYILLSATLFSTQSHGSLTLKGLEIILKKPKTQTLEDLISQLPRELRSNYSLMHKSQCVQHAQPQHPRAILFGKNANLVLTFTDSTQKGGDSVGVMEFKTKDSEFHFHEIRFEANQRPILEKDVKRCQNCHLEKGKPIWDKYPNWAGAYGSDDDTLNRGKERAHYDKFLTQAYDHPRYKYLIGKVAQGQTSDPKDTPNLRLTSLLIRLNSKRIFGILSRSPLYNELRYPLALALGGCRDEISNKQDAFKIFESLKLENPQIPIHLKKISHFNPPEGVIDFKEKLDSILFTLGIESRAELQIHAHPLHTDAELTTMIKKSLVFGYEVPSFYFEDDYMDGYPIIGESWPSNQGAFPSQRNFIFTLVMKNLEKSDRRFKRAYELNRVTEPSSNQRFLKSLDATLRSARILMALPTPPSDEDDSESPTQRDPASKAPVLPPTVGDPTLKQRRTKKALPLCDLLVEKQKLLTR